MSHGIRGVSILVLALVPAALAAQLRIITGTVRGDSTNVPLESVLVSTSGVPTMLSDSAGRFVLHAVPRGKVTILLRRLAYEDMSITLPAGRDTTVELHLTMRQAWKDYYRAGDLADAHATRVLTGTIRDSLTRQPIEHVTVSVSGTELTTFTDIDGQFRIPAAPHGALQLTIGRLGYRASVMSLPAGGDTALSLRLSTALRLPIPPQRDTLAAEPLFRPRHEFALPIPEPRADNSFARAEFDFIHARRQAAAGSRGGGARN